MGLTTQTYDILTRLAVGNGALVYRAVNKVTHRQVALKLLVQDGDLDHRFDVAALLADSPRLRQITGVHVCQLIDAHVDDDGPVLVYEFANGMSGAELPAQRELDAGQALDVAAQLISALRSGERQKCPHGDVKPSNIVFMELADKRPFTLVLDWGLTAYRTTTADDSLPYLAPERLTGSPASHRADLFSAGAALFFFFTGKALVAGTNREELKSSWQATRPALLSELRPDLPAKFVQWICSLLELAPEKRPESAVDALAALAALNPPPPPIPPETFRPRAATLPSASGIVKPPVPPRPKPPSTIRKALPPPAVPAEPAVPPAPVKPAAKSAPPRVKKSHVAMTLGMFGIFVMVMGTSVWLLFFRKTETRYPGDAPETETRHALEERKPAPSIGPDIGKKITPLPPTPAPVKKVASAAKPQQQDAKKQPAPKAGEKPTPTPAQKPAATAAPKPAKKPAAKPAPVPDAATAPPQPAAK